MLRFVLGKLALIIPTFIGVTFLSFILIRLVPGDPIEVRVGERGIAPERLAELRHEFGLDQPLWKQFADYEVQVVTGGLGQSLVTRESVWTEFTTLFPATLELGVCAIGLGLIFGIPLGVFAAVKRGSAFDYGLMGLSVTGASMPIFWWGLMMILVFSVALGWTPVSGRIAAQYYVEPWSGFMLIDCWFDDEKGVCLSAARSLILPAIVLGTQPMAVVARMTRSSMLEVLGEDYIRTARAKGVGSSQLVLQHALRNSLIPIITVVGLYFGTLIGNSVLTEIIFNRPGLGKLIIGALNARDYTLLQGLMIIFAICVIVVNTLTDLAYGLVDPRVKFS